MSTMHKVPFARHAVVRVGLIGAGGRGLSLLGELLACDGVAVTAVADTQPEAVARAAVQVAAAGQPTPQTFSGATALPQLLAMSVDLVYIATPIETHTPYAVAALEAGKHVAVEVPAATTVDECWQLVETSERTRRHCVMLENCCYAYWEMLVKRMVAAQVLGEVVHAECAYLHDLRAALLRDRPEALWRRAARLTRNGNLYPTHGLGPVAQCLQIGEGDAFDYLVSMSSREAGLSTYRDRTVPPDSAIRQENYPCGDMNVSLVRTKLGKTIVLQYDIVTPRPYERALLIAGTKGTFRDYPPRLFLDGEGQHTAWQALDNYRAAWEDPLWTQLGELARKRSGHGGMDFIMTYRLIQTMQAGLPPDMDVYDAADWSVPGPLSEQSVAQRSAGVDFPNFRRGAGCVQRTADGLRE